jgi:DNA polymerase III alpha subunit
LCFLVGITEVDPLPHGLLFERFIDMTRFDLPDIDIDFSDTRRDMVFDHLRSKYGEDHIARVGNVSTLKGRSLIAEVCKRFRIPDAEKFKLYDVLVEHERGSERFGKSMIDTFETDIGKAFIQRYPQAAVMTELEAHAWHTSIHAAGVIVSNDPVSDYCTVGSDGVAQITKPDAEALNLLKIDALGLRTLGVIEDSGVVTPDELYRLPLNDKKVFDIFNAHRYSSVFQFEGSQQKLLSNEVRVDDFRTIDHLTALARPGPLGGGAAAHYIKRKAGLEEIDFIHRLARPILADTYGVMLYQEQVMRMVREIGGFSWEDTSIIRKAISLSKGAETVNKLGQTFLKGAMKNGVSEKVARELWSMIVTFGGYGMNRAHTCSYAIISYYCAWMKAYHPLEFAAACLRSAKDDDAALAVLREMRDEGINYTPFDVDLSTETWSVVDGKLIGGFQNLVGIGPAKAATAVEQRNNGSLDREKFLAMKVKFDDLYPLQSKYRQWYLNPESMGCAEGSTLLTADRFPDHGDVLYLGKIVEKQPGDDNDPKRVEKRGGKTYKGNTLFVDFILKDDLGMPVRCRVNRRDWEHLGKLANERLNVGDDLLVRGDKLPGYSMFIVVNRLMCLNRPEALR